MSSFLQGPSVIFTIVPLVILAGFVLVITLFAKNLAAVAKDRKKPIIPTKATVIAKRTHVWGDNSSTTYYATFELENDERLELKIPDHKAGYLIEGDYGTLSFQGELFVDFIRE